MKEDYEAVITNMIKIRNDKKLGQQAVAEKMGISGATYSRYESKTISLSYEALTSYANAVGMRVIDVITYPDVYVNRKEVSSTKVLIELDVTPDEFISMGLKEKVIKVLNK